VGLGVGVGLGAGVGLGVGVGVAVLNITEDPSVVPGTLTRTLSTAVTVIEATACPLVAVTIVVEAPPGEVSPLLNVMPSVVLVKVTGIPGSSLETASTVAVITTSSPTGTLEGGPTEMT
jgi:hypothetical protein